MKVASSKHKTPVLVKLRSGAWGSIEPKDHIYVMFTEKYPVMSPIPLAIVLKLVYPNNT